MRLRRRLVACSEDNQRIILSKAPIDLGDLFSCQSDAASSGLRLQESCFSFLLRLGHGVPEYDSHRPQRAGRGMEQGCRAG